MQPNGWEWETEMSKPAIKHCLTTLALLALAPGLVLAEQGKVLKSNEVTADVFTRAVLSGEGAPESELGPGVRARTLGARPAQAAQPARPSSVSVLITFNTNSAILTPSARAALDQIGKALGKNQLADLNFVLEGHADPRGTDELNQRLSQERAESVVQYLVSSHGINANRLKPVGKGAQELLKPEQPTAPENRRVTFVPSGR
jgi:outer membrane protein OmpA-like peptidoglycan-associated protein